MSRALPPSGRVADAFGRLPVHTRTSILECPLHSELAELCLRVSVCTHMGIYCVCVCEYVYTCVQVTGHPHGLLEGLRLRQSAEVINLLPHFH